MKIKEITNEKLYKNTVKSLPLIHIHVLQLELYALDAFV